MGAAKKCLVKYMYGRHVRNGLHNVCYATGLPCYGYSGMEVGQVVDSSVFVQHTCHAKVTQLHLGREGGGEMKGEPSFSIPELMFGCGGDMCCTASRKTVKFRHVC